MGKFKAGVAFGNQAWDILNEAKARQAALPAVNVTGSNTINAALEAARDVNSPIIIQLSHGGSAFYAGKGLSNENQQASIRGAIAAALHIHNLSTAYNVPVILHTDHAAKKLLPWIDGLLEAGEAYFKHMFESVISSVAAKKALADIYPIEVQHYLTFRSALGDPDAIKYALFSTIKRP